MLRHVPALLTHRGCLDVHALTWARPGPLLDQPAVRARFPGGARLPLLAFQPKGGSLGVSDVRTLLKYLAHAFPGGLHAILVAHKASAQASAMLHAAQGPHRVFELLGPRDVLCLKHRHQLVPVFRRLSEAEVAALERRVGPRQHLSRLLASDAMARYHHFRPGDVVEATSPYFGTQVRRVV